MFPQLLFVLGALVAAWLFLDWFKRAKPQVAARAAKMAAFGLLALFGVWLVLTGKLAGLFAVAAGIMPWVARAVRLHGWWKVLRGLGIRVRGGRAAAGGASQVETRFLRMELDHDTGRFDGQVLAGSLSGRMLSSLDADEALALWRETAVDAESARVLEAWLDRAWPDWRGRPSASAAAPPSGRAGMSVEEAREILGVGADAGAEEIRAAHRRLMLANHPDHGGSTWIAARINQARDLLLG
ncbi:molecular chaperone DnaJ [Magnetospirillum aberrantis]|uniref:Molecular chaperone DnaJ n=1 Tax=Magnetospirillum aberrantis SpK TaxID=908842 RepID=A0A7C9UW20_9PROT|nr:molecular chaperone DnaJ [Magnetospirillum aberrantis]NFV81386.1 molecular chaperone DnaJ [Magnetospirillum aberrantis SpK]